MNGRMLTWVTLYCLTPMLLARVLPVQAVVTVMPIVDYVTCNDRQGVPQFDIDGHYIGCLGMNPKGFRAEIPAAPLIRADGYASYTIDQEGPLTTVHVNGPNGEDRGTISGRDEYKGTALIQYATVQLPNRTPLHLRLEGEVLTVARGEKELARYRVKATGPVLGKGQLPPDTKDEIALLFTTLKDGSLSAGLERVSYLTKPQNCPWWVTLAACVSTPSNPASAVVCGACVGVAIINKLK